MNFCKFSSICLIYKVLHGLAPSPLLEFIKYRPTRLTRAVVNKLRFLLEKPPSAIMHSINGSALWNTLPPTIRECPTLATF